MDLALCRLHRSLLAETENRMASRLQQQEQRAADDLAQLTSRHEQELAALRVRHTHLLQSQLARCGGLWLELASSRPGPLVRCCHPSFMRQAVGHSGVCYYCMGDSHIGCCGAAPALTATR
jgi:hypothetical protein